MSCSIYEHDIFYAYAAFRKVDAFVRVNVRAFKEAGSAKKGGMYFVT